MRIPLSVLLILFFITSRSQQDTANFLRPAMKNHQSHPVLATMSLGFIDPYRNDYSLPSGYIKNNTSDYSLFYAKLECYLNNQLSLAATFGHDAFIYNYSKVYSGNNGNFIRYKTDGFRLFSGGLTAFYHLGSLIRAKHLDPFVGFGLSLNNIRYSAYPQGDTVAVRLTHTVTPYLKAGARYYISEKFSLFGDVGYDNQSIFSLGFSCRFSKKHSYPQAAPLSHYITVQPHYIHHLPLDIITYNPPDSNMKAVTGKHNDAPLIIDSTDNNPLPHNDSLTDGKLPLLKKNTIQFQLGKSVIRTSSYPILDTIVNVLIKTPKLILHIDGYTDITGKPSVNRRISQERADVVKKYFIIKGIEPYKLIARGHGSRHPIASNHTKIGRAKNRRVVVSMSLKSSHISMEQ